MHTTPVVVLMRDRLVELARQHPYRTALLATALACLLAFAISESVRWVHWRAFDRAAQAVVDTPASGHGRLVTLSFDSLGERHTVDVRVDDAELEALRPFPAGDAFSYRGRWRERFVTTLVDMQVRSQFVDNLASSLRRISHRRSLSSDAYLELLVAAVQSIPYAASENGVRAPAQVVFDGQGICTEKSITLAALMVHEGYDTVLWSFATQRHVALGVATAGPSYRDTGYAFIETTRPAFVGEVDPIYRSSGPIHSPPEQISLGGTKRYTAGAQVAYILRALEDARKSARRSSAYPVYARTAGAHRDEFEQHAADHARARELVDFISGNVTDRPRVFGTLRERFALS